jgi:hypothetical protein
MPVTVQPTPNPNAMKFTVGVSVGGPTTVVAGQDADDPTIAALIALPGVTSVFMTGDFVTISKVPDVSWEEIGPAAQGILIDRYGA